jgi:threonine dehydratase
VCCEDDRKRTVLVATGSAAGVAAAAFRGARIVAVEPERCPTLSRAMTAEQLVDVPVSGVAADSLGARRVGAFAFAAQQAEPPTSVLVTDEDIVRARSWLWSEYRMPSEFGAATVYAVLLSGRYVPSDGERVEVVVCGANTDPTTVTTCN